MRPFPTTKRQIDTHSKLTRPRKWRNPSKSNSMKYESSAVAYKEKNDPDPSSMDMVRSIQIYCIQYDFLENIHTFKMGNLHVRLY